MNQQADEIHFDCPKCKRPMAGDKALLGEMINCPDCKEPFFPVPRRPAPEPAPQFAPIIGPKESSRPAPASTDVQLGLRDRRAKIQSQAEAFGSFAIFCVVIGVISMVIGIRLSIGQDDADTCWRVMAAAFGLAFWFYFVAQIIHIRANTEK